MKYEIKGSRSTGKTIFWIGLYVLITLAPLLIAMGLSGMPRRDFWTEFSVALGFIGLTMMCLQFFLTARFRRVTAPYGIDIILQYHRYISMVAAVFILAHPIILFITRPETRDLLNPLTAPIRAQMAWLAVIALFLLIIFSLWREKLGQKYEVWKTIHGLLALIAVTAAYLHVLGVGYYLSDLWKRYFWEAMFVGTILLLAYIRVIKPWQLTHKPWEVSKIKKERGESWTLTFKPKGHKGFRFRPGQFVWLTTKNSPFAIEEHPFSISSSAKNMEEISLTIKELGDYTTGIGEKVKEGTRAYLDGPYGVFTIDRAKNATGFVFIAGGVGITPIISMVRTMADRNDQRPAMLIYGSQNYDDITFREEIEDLEKRMKLTVIHVLQEADEGWEGESGYIDKEKLDRLLPKDRCSRNYFICGPTPLMNAAEDALLELDVPVENIEMEIFNLV